MEEELLIPHREVDSESLAAINWLDRPIPASLISVDAYQSMRQNNSPPDRYQEPGA